MAFSQGKKFRRLVAQAMAADQRDMQAQIERALPRGENGKRFLRLARDVDRRAASVAVAAALLADEITCDQAQAMLDRLEGRQQPTPEEQAREEGRPPSGGRRWREDDPLADFFRALEEGAARDAARQPGTLVNNNGNTSENTSAAAGGEAAGERRPAEDSLESL